MARYMQLKFLNKAVTHSDNQLMIVERLFCIIIHTFIPIHKPENNQSFSK